MWKPIAEAPKDGTLVDLWVVFSEEGGGTRYTDCIWDGKEWVLGSQGYRVSQYAIKPRVTHWQPLPEPPEA